jgi:chromosome segregation ATPase
MARGYDQKAVGKLESALNLEGLSPAERLQLQRWLMLARAMEEGPRAKVSMRDFRPGLIQAVQALEREGLEEARTYLEAELDKPDLARVTAARDYLQHFLDEVDARIAIEQAKAAEKQAKSTLGETANAYEEAAEAYKRVISVLQRLFKRAPMYHDALTATMPGLLEHAEEVQAQVERDQLRRQERERIAKTTQRAENLLREAISASDQELSWPENLRDILDDVDEQQQPPLARLRQVDRAMRQEDYLMALDVVASLSHGYPNWQLASLAQRLCARLVLRRAHQLAKQARWPDEVREGLALLKALDRFGLITEQYRGQMRQSEQRLEEREKLQKELRAVFGDPPEPLEELDAPERDRALQKALQQGIELFDRSQGEEGRWSVNRVLSMRETARLHMRLDTLNQELSSLLERLHQREKALRSLAGELGSIEENVTRVQERLGELRLDESRLNLLTKRVQDLEALNRLLQGQVRDLDATEEQVLTLEKKAKDLQERLARAMREVEQAESQARNLKQRMSAIQPLAQPSQQRPSGRVAESRKEDGLSKLLAEIADQVWDNLRTNRLSELAEQIQGQVKQAEEDSYDVIAELFTQLDEMKDSPENLPKFTEVLDKLKHMRNLSGEEQARLERWMHSHSQRNMFVKRAEELSRQWSKLLPPAQRTEWAPDPNRLQEVLEQTNQLVTTAPPDLPSPYWEKLSGQLELTYTRLLSSQGVDFPELLVWLGLLHFRVQFIMKGSQA